MASPQQSSSSEDEGVKASYSGSDISSSDVEDQQESSGHDALTAPLGRREIASEGSEYALSEKSKSSGESEPELEEKRKPKQKIRPKSGSIVKVGSDSEVEVSQAPPDVAVSTKPRKRRARPSQDLDLELPPSKRAKTPFRLEYLALLNDDIGHAAARQVAPDPEAGDLRDSQVGLTIWTAEEKEACFEALSRLGRGDLPGIARRIKTKGVLEVSQYLQLYDKEIRRRKDGPKTLSLGLLQLADYPAAVEISDECCSALDAAADAVAVRMDRREQKQEEKHWGLDDWLISPENYGEIEEKSEDPKLEFIKLFKLQNWLLLPERFFMNAPLPESNWRCFEDGMPSIRTTALGDFYSLAVSITKRLVATTLWFAQTRIHQRKRRITWIKNHVRKSDVRAALASLGLSQNRRKSWAGMARRLKLSVLDDEEDTFMTYDEVEKTLRSKSRGYKSPFEGSRGKGAPTDDSQQASNAEVEKNVSESGNETGYSTDKTAEYDSEIERDVAEVYRHTAMGFPDSLDSRRSLRVRIKHEIVAERYAEVIDQKASLREETELWHSLRRDPPNPPRELEEMRRPVGKGALEDLHPVGKNWKEKLDYVSEWEVDLLIAERNGVKDEGAE